jgi:hypothetical protein
MTRQRWFGMVLPLAAILMVIVMFAIGAEGAKWAIGGLCVGAVAVAGSFFKNAPSSGAGQDVGSR